jgi:uncharacterized protein YndB with AHSA1/START domain
MGNEPEANAQGEALDQRGMRSSFNDYEFLTRWRVEGSVDEVYDIISKPLEFPRWWPSVYLSAVQLQPPDPTGVGQRMRFRTKGRLPYTLDWDSQTVEAERPYRLVIRAERDFNGRGVWQFQQAGRFVDITFDWKLRADKPLIRKLSFLLKPAFAANHRWAMARGLEGLKQELQRRRSQSAT